jgi:hypothetical protein
MHGTQPEHATVMAPSSWGLHAALMTFQRNFRVRKLTLDWQSDHISLRAVSQDP